MTAAEFADRLHGRRTGSGWEARCPAHDDQHASLTIRDGDRSVLVKCHAGCAFPAILAALGLTTADLRHEAPAPAPPAAAPLGEPVATYPYEARDGTLRYEVLRYAPKTFRQRRPGAAGGWHWHLNGTPRVLYRLPRLTGHATVYVVEGEKDAERLWRLHLPATTNAGGAGRWRDTYASQLREAGVQAVVILPDQDAPGEAHARTVARSCRAAGLAVRLVRLPGLPPKGDVSDWLDAGHTREELEALVGATAPVTDPARLEEPVSAGSRPTGLAFTRLGDLLEEPEETCPWLVADRLPAGGLSLLVGKPKAGKSTLARGLALAVARGEPWLGWPTTRGMVFYLALEEKRGEVRAHFLAMGAADEDVRVFVAPAPEDGLRQLRAAAERDHPVLIIVDPLLRFVRVRDANDYAEMTRALEPLLVLARETGAHLLAVHHAGKGERTGLDSILGSTAIAGAVDTALLLNRTEHYRTLRSEQRYGVNLDETTLTLDPVTRVVTAGPSRQEADEHAATAAMVEYLRRQADPVEEPAIHEAVEGRRQVKLSALRRLVAEGTVARTGAGKRGDPYRYTVSGFLVPTYIREPENQKVDNPLIASPVALDSGPRCFGVSVSGSRDPWSLREGASGTPAGGENLPAHGEGCDCPACLPAEVGAVEEEVPF